MGTKKAIDGEICVYCSRPITKQDIGLAVYPHGHTHRDCLLLYLDEYDEKNAKKPKHGILEK